MNNITFPLNRTDGPKGYDHAQISDANGISLAYVLKRPARGVDGAKLADLIIALMNQNYLILSCFRQDPMPDTDLAIQSIKRRDCWHSILSCALYLVRQDEIETAIQRLEELRVEIAATIPENAEEIYADAAQAAR